MRQLRSYGEEPQARRLEDLLASREIECQVSAARDGTHGVWVLAEAALPEARALAEAFDADPDAPEHREAAGAAARLRRAEEQAARAARERQIDVGRAASAGARPPAVTVAVIGLSLLATYAVSVLGRADVEEALRIGTLEDADRGEPFGRVLSGQLHRLITPIFLHYGALHLLFNLWWLWDLGTALERRLGSPRFLWIVVASAAFSNAAQLAGWGSPAFGGTSGVLYALVGYTWVRARRDPGFGLALPEPTIVILMVWLGLGLTGLVGQIANGAHLGGLAAGALMGRLAARR